MLVTECPKCAAKYQVPDNLVGKSVRCRQCAFVFEAGEPPPKTVLLEDELTTASPRPRKRAAPAAAARPDRRDDRPRGREDDAHPERDGGYLGVWIGLGVAGGVVFLGLVGGLVYALVNPDAAPPAVVAQAPPVKPGPDPGPDVPLPPEKQPPVEKVPVEKQPPIVRPPVERPPVIDPPFNPPPFNPFPQDPPRNPPPVADKDVQKVQLPGTVSALVPGGGERYLFAHIASKRQIAVFDTAERKVVKYLAVGGDRALLAAGQEELFAVLPDTRVIQRWDLKTFTAGKPTPLTISDVKSAAMGAASVGPLVVASGTDIREMGRKSPLTFLDPATLQPLDLTPDEKGGRMPFGFGGGLQVAAAANGELFGAWESGVSPSGVYALAVSGKQLVSKHRHESHGAILPGPDGARIFAGMSVFTAELNPVGENKPEGFLGRRYFPALAGPWFLEISTERDRDLGLPPGVVLPGRGPGGPGRLHLGREPNAVADLPPLPELQSDIFERNQTLSLHQRVHFAPRAKALVTLPDSASELWVRTLDPEAALAKSGRDYFLVMSVPPTRFTPGETLTYQVVARTNKGGVTMKLEAGPKGMALAKDGTLTWAVPADFAEPEADVLVSLQDAGKQEALHTFRLRSASAKPGAVVRRDPPEMPANPGPEPTPGPGPSEPVGPIVAGKVKDVTTIALPDVAGDVVVGGDGRYLIFHIKRVRQAAVLDLNEGKITKYLPLAEEHALLAAGMTRLMVVYPDRGVIQRWNLATLEKEVQATLPITGRVGSIAMGSASEGPLVLTGAGRGVGLGENGLSEYFINPHTLKAFRPTWGGSGHRLNESLVRVAADGRSLAMWRRDVSPSGIQTAVMGNGTATGYYEHNSAGHLLPGPDGQTLFTGAGLYTMQCKPLEAGNAARKAYFPAVHGRGYLSLGSTRGGVPGLPGEKADLGVHLLGIDQPIQTRDLPAGFDLPDVFGNRDGLPLDKRLIWVPSAGVLATVPLAANKVTLHPLDLGDLLKKSNLDYLVVTSQPVTRAARGKPYAYKLDVLSNKAGFTYEVSAGPTGMTIDADGKVAWAVPAMFNEAAVDIILTVKNAAGREAFHSFRIDVARQ